jgi:acyl carrier protein
MLEKKIIKVLSKSVPLFKDPSEISTTENLFELGLDSLTITDFITALEKEFNIKMKIDPSFANKFQTVSSIDTFLCSLLDKN